MTEGALPYLVMDSWLAEAAVRLAPGMAREQPPRRGMVYAPLAREAEAAASTRDKQPELADCPLVGVFYDATHFCPLLLAAGDSHQLHQQAECFAKLTGVRVVRADEEHALLVADSVQPLTECQQRPPNCRSVDSVLRDLCVSAAAAHDAQPAEYAARPFAPLSWFDDCVVGAAQSEALDQQLALHTMGPRQQQHQQQQQQEEEEEKQQKEKQIEEIKQAEQVQREKQRHKQRKDSEAKERPKRKKARRGDSIDPLLWLGPRLKAKVLGQKDVPSIGNRGRP